MQTSDPRVPVYVFVFVDVCRNLFGASLFISQALGLSRIVAQVSDVFYVIVSFRFCVVLVKFKLT